MRSWKLSAHALFGLALAIPARAQAPYLVKDINTTADASAATEPDDLTAATDALYFLGADYGNGFELRRYTGSGPVSFLVDFDPGPNGKPFRPPPAATGNRVFYFAGSGLWITDGTLAGTVLLRRTDETFNFPTERAIANGTLFFFAQGTGGSQQLWKSDGTPAGTVPVATLYGAYLTTAGNRAFFVRDEPGTGAELWTSDGTTAGTHMVKDLCPGSCPGIASTDELEAVGDVLFFAGNDLTSGEELFRSDGTAAGTGVVKEILPGPSGPFVSSLARFGSVLLFQADDGLWRSDGTAAGTYLLKPDVRFDIVYDAGGTAFFNGRESATGTELWKTDGTPSGTVRVTDGCVGPCDFILNPVFSSVPGAVLFAEYEGQVLWRSDGTAAGTIPVRSFASIGPSLARLGAEMFFPADDGSHGRELWRTDGSLAGTAMVTDRADSPSFWRELSTVRDRYFFLATRPDLGNELWSSSGSEASTSFVDLTPGPGSPDVFGVGSLRSNLLFSGYAGGFPPNVPPGYWKSDGTPGGTVKLQPVTAGPSSAENGQIAVFSAAWTEGLSRELWRTDGTVGGTYPIGAPPTVIGSSPQTIVRFRDEFVFTMSTTGLWRTDGTAEGTRQLYDRPCGEVVVVDERIFATCYEPATGFELWTSDGTALGTHRVKDTNPGGGGGGILDLTDVEGALFFHTAGQLWLSDGTEAGTQLLHTFTPLPSDLQARNLTVSKGVLYFSGHTPASGEELWRTDGTAAGTFMVADILPGPPSGLFDLAPFADGVILTTATPARGVELSRSDGTPGNVVPLPEIAPGPPSGSPNYFQHADGHLFFHATDGTTGYELWAVAEPSGTLEVGDATVLEGDAGTTNAQFEVRLVSPSAAPVTVAYATVAGTAQVATDFVPRSGVLTFAPGTQALPVDVPVVGDLQDETDEAFFLALSSVSGGVIADGRGSGVIRDDDGPQVTLSSASVAEGDVGTTDAVFGVTLTTSNGAPTQEAKTVAYATESVTAAAGIDFDGTSGTLTFPPASASGSTLNVRVPVRGDTADEPDETFHLRLASHSDALVPHDPAQGLILDDDGVNAARSVELAHGSTIRATLEPPAGRSSDRDFYTLAQQPRASYELVADEVSGDALPLDVRRIAADGTTVLQSAQAVGTGPALSLRWVNTTSTPITDEQVRVESAACGSLCGADDVYRLRLYETTLAASRFNNTGSQVTVAILHNTSSVTVSGQVLLWLFPNFPPVVSPFQIGPHGTLVLNTSTVLSGNAGSITVIHDAPYGVLAGKTVALDPATGFSFDTPLTYRPR